MRLLRAAMLRGEFLLQLSKLLQSLLFLCQFQLQESGFFHQNIESAITAQQLLFQSRHLFSQGKHLFRHGSFGLLGQHRAKDSDHAFTHTQVPFTGQNHILDFSQPHFCHCAFIKERASNVAVENELVDLRSNRSNRGLKLCIFAFQFFHSCFTLYQSFLGGKDLRFQLLYKFDFFGQLIAVCGDLIGKLCDLIIFGDEADTK
mmetsp:Transcript_35277/g.80600  ORF Transcript_35277/g.80600 Transcript_35277/m.80600 type:complete len:203 (+) Transcript_35277:108-716(+)